MEDIPRASVCTRVYTIVYPRVYSSVHACIPPPPRGQVYTEQTYAWEAVESPPCIGARETQQPHTTSGSVGL